MSEPEESRHLTPSTERQMLEALEALTEQAYDLQVGQSLMEADIQALKARVKNLERASGGPPPP